MTCLHDISMGLIGEWGNLQRDLRQLIHWQLEILKMCCMNLYFKVIEKINIEQILQSICWQYVSDEAQFSLNQSVAGSFALNRILTFTVAEKYGCITIRSCDFFLSYKWVIGNQGCNIRNNKCYDVFRKHIAKLFYFL